MAGEMTEAEIVRLCKAHSMFSWSKGNDKPLAHRAG